MVSFLCWFQLKFEAFWTLPMSMLLMFRPSRVFCCHFCQVRINRTRNVGFSLFCRDPLGFGDGVLVNNDIVSKIVLLKSFESSHTFQFGKCFAANYIFLVILYLKLEWIYRSRTFLCLFQFHLFSLSDSENYHQSLKL